MGIQLNQASLNGALTQHKNKDIKTLKKNFGDLKDMHSTN